MSTQRKELVATADAIIAVTEAALKQLAVMFNRIAIQGLFVDYSKAHFISPDFAKTRSWLAELGVLFDADMKQLKSPADEDLTRVREICLEDTDSYTKQTFGMSAQELIAAQSDEQKVAETKQRALEAKKKFEDGTIDPVQMMQLNLRMTTYMNRMFAGYLRDAENLDVYPIFLPEFSSFEHDDPRLTKHDVLRICVGALPLPIYYVPWQQLLDYRNDPDTKDSFLLIKEWISEVARGTFPPVQVEETLEYLIDRFRRKQETHGINTTTTGLFAYVVTTPKVLETLAGVGPDWGTRALFEIDHCQIGLLPTESISPGSIVAFLLQMDMNRLGDGRWKQPA